MGHHMQTKFLHLVPASATLSRIWHLGCKSKWCVNQQVGRASPYLCKVNYLIIKFEYPFPTCAQKLNSVKRTSGLCVRKNPEAELKNVNKKISDITREIQVLEGRKQHWLRKRETEGCNSTTSSALLAQKDWERQDFPWSSKLDEIRNSVFRISEFRPYQLPTMNATLSGTDCILIMPTGGGKSLCYQLPALICKGISLVVSPLVSLMEDQIMGLRAVGVDARMLSAETPKEEVNLVYTAMTDPKGPVKLLYVTPERLAKSKRFMAKVQKMHQMGLFARLAIDEVHCCSQWGHDFRPDYKFLGVMRKMFPDVPILGLTATATSRVIIDVQKILNMQGCLILKASFNRPNLFYEVRPKPSSPSECIDELEKLLKGEFKGYSGIIYALSIKDTEELAKELRARDVKVAPYHAMLEAESRSKIHRKWVENFYQVVVATIAFGMGIDKPDVRFVIHHCISKSMENFYQESGRAGRDGKPAKCLVFWRYADFARQSTMVFTEQTGLENLYGLISYCLDGNRCRRNVIAEHFDERWDASDCNGMCDHCRTPRETKNLDLRVFSEQLLMILTKALSKNQRLTGQKLVDAWLGKGAKDARVQEAITKDLSRDRAENIVAFLILDGFLKEDFHFTPYSTISYIIAGPKAEMGLSPSAMAVGGTRKDVSYGDSNLRALLRQNEGEGCSNGGSNQRVQIKSEDEGRTTKNRDVLQRPQSQLVTSSSKKNKKENSSTSGSQSSSSGHKSRSNNSSVSKSFHMSKKEGENSNDQVRKKQRTEDDSGSTNHNHSEKSTSELSRELSEAEENEKFSNDSELGSSKRKRIITIEDTSDDSDF
ncbi:ATP-dependent DNA helicase Q1-like [Macrobrachium nipponense]|uniref:ATP-dependent DNA helicase Q1-like n=1 Tax=Macrobrachium nipponense TaxID=159736 RepID=UPI0030C84DEF